MDHGRHHHAADSDIFHEMRFEVEEEGVIFLERLPAARPKYADMLQRCNIGLRGGRCAQVLVWTVRTVWGAELHICSSSMAVTVASPVRVNKWGFESCMT